MCGITGFFAFNNENLLSNQVIKKMTDVISHRGPDDAGYFTVDSSDKKGIYQKNELPEDGLAKLAFGHRRLSIIDLSALGHQPMKSADGKIVITLNGEIYNYLELRSELQELGYHFISESDTEVAVYA